MAHTTHGKYAGVAAASREHKIPYTTLIKRIRDMELTLQEAIAYKRPESMAAKARAAGVNYRTVEHRVRAMGETIDQALTGPRRHSGRPRIIDGDLVGLQSVADKAGVTRQRVQQVMKERNLTLGQALTFLEETAKLRGDRKVRPVACKGCGETGHNIRTCAKRKRSGDGQPATAKA